MHEALLKLDVTVPQRAISDIMMIDVLDHIKVKLSMLSGISRHQNSHLEKDISIKLNL